MEYYWNNSNNTSSTARGHNGNFFTNPAWDSSWDLAARPDWNFYSPRPQPIAAAAAAARQADLPAVMAQHQEKTSPPLYYNPDPHMTCLKLGKRHYFGDLAQPPPPLAASGTGPLFTTKRGKAAGSEGPSSAAAAAAAGCQVVGCTAALATAKDYHRRHKVCEMHAKAPKVVLLGIEQRFCQQCSRFHALAEFDEAKRSCRRRLAGHNERRRKTYQEHNSLAKKHYQEIKMMGGDRNQSVSKGERALSLLSPTNLSQWSASLDLPARCSAALRELIAENRSSVFMNRGHIGSSWAAAAENRDHVTLNLMQDPASCFGLISPQDHRRSSEDDSHDADLWKLPLGY